ncbi:MAG: NERD domain-containing protein, partial [Planctomycetes bacterium]|nr:NERD domain-containing protein [Planctomycetota bacterium]
MARMFPVQVPEGKESERLVAELLKEQLGEDWTIYYSFEYLKREKRRALLRQGEIDFILLKKGVGLLLLEVKGGTVRYEQAARKWLGKSGKGTEYGLDPVGQASENLSCLLSILGEVAGFGSKVPFAHGKAVLFPQCHINEGILPPSCRYGDGDPNSFETILWDDRMLDRLGEMVETTLSLWSGGFRGGCPPAIENRIVGFFESDWSFSSVE